MKLFYLIHKSSIKLAEACSGNPVLTTATTMLFFLLFNVFEGTIEVLLFGERFQCLLDPVFSVLFIAYAGHAVVSCAIYNSERL